MDQHVTPWRRTLPPVLRQALETVEMLVQDLAVGVVEGTASPEEFEEAREYLRRQQDVVSWYLRAEAEGELFAFPRAERLVAPAGH